MRLLTYPWLKTSREEGCSLRVRNSGAGCTWNNEGEDTCLSSQISQINPGTQSDKCHSQVALISQKEPLWNKPEHSVLKEACPQGKLVDHSLQLTWGKGNTQLEPTLAILSYLTGLGGKKRETFVEFTVQRYRLTKRRDLLMWWQNFPSPTPHITKGLFKTVSFTWYIMSSYQEKVTSHIKRHKTQFEELEQASEPDMARTLESSDWGFKITMIKMLRTLLDKLDSTQEQRQKTDKQCKRRDGNPRKEPKRNPRDKKHCNRNEDYLWRAH